ncbi:hypothetical protein PF005_g13799 [Phytophthora fragariae]|uniref:Glycosyl hydrolase family 30 beta sandwich domain-containing protein n=1 Tax=Phytophthora fragariae TaxID=53985 RepID=A0A6A4D9R6_9STRA|nr:hypothetical protein PF003_g5239 [Phytophthora fragariae]KAE8935269.1 hypothetical protein PF009_g14770 [Phytophthora fragariae]KAE9003725.1 hypothetical protein PF011_g12779 [Phytophthora fragariae]KAE9104065.1 hypothetical protein PF010_g13510 [Phytophthora fragariae]KAE9104250.1 hypothetical protein PF007_g14115 [Phytophthora fragariae]
MALDATSKLLVLATVNTGTTASTVTFDLSSFKTVAGPITAWTTETRGQGRCTSLQRSACRARRTVCRSLS